MFKLCDLGRLTIVYQSSHICLFIFIFKPSEKERQDFQNLKHREEVCQLLTMHHKKLEVHI